MKKRYLLGTLSLAVIFAASGISQYLTHSLFESNVNKILSKIDTKGVSVKYKTEKTSLLTKEGELTVSVAPQVRFEGTTVEPIKFKFKTDTLLLPAYTRTNLSPVDPESKKYFKSFKVDRAQLSTVVNKAEFLINSKKNEKAEMNISLFGFDQNKCTFENGEVKLSQDEGNSVLVNTKASKFNCSQKLPYQPKESKEFLAIEDLKATTTLNRVVDKNFNLKAPDYFSLSMEKFSMAMFGNFMKLKAVDINRSVIGDGTREKLYINLFIDQGAMVNRFNLQGEGDRYIEGEKGKKSGKYHVLMQGPIWGQIPVVQKMYAGKMFNTTKSGLESDITYSVDTDKVNMSQPMVNNPDAIKLNINGKETTPTELFMLVN